ncbi:MAG: FHA domain-containing protein [Nocardioides sp.]
MTAPIDVAADLTFTLETPEGRRVAGHLAGRGQVLRLDVDDSAAFAGRGDAAGVRAVADALAARGLKVEVHSHDRRLLTLGAVRAPWWQRRVTGSAHLRVAGLRGAWTSLRARSRAQSEAVLPTPGLAPPATLLPLLPTLARRPARITTTHATYGSGDPRLVLAPREDPWPGDRQPVFRLRRDVVTIGSAPDAGICLPGLRPYHAEVHHETDDEFRILDLCGDTRVNGERVRKQLLRTGSRIRVGPWTMAFSREEYADHGRPHGGRIGGEAGHQRPQPPRRRLNPDATGYEATREL